MVSKPDSSLPSSTNSTPTPSNYNKHSSREQASIATTTTTTTTIERTPRSTCYRQHTSQNMSSPQGSPQGPVGQSYMLVPNLHVPDPTVDEIELDNTNAWMVATVIEDHDLMFGGKPLSAWYEEDRRRLSSSNEDEEEIRGRQRDPVVRFDAHHQHRHQQTHHQPQLQHHHHYQHHTAHHPHVAHTHHTTKKTGEIKH